MDPCIVPPCDVQRSLWCACPHSPAPCSYRGTLPRLMRPSSVAARLYQVEEHYGFKAKIYHCADCETQQDFYDK